MTVMSTARHAAIRAARALGAVLWQTRLARVSLDEGRHCMQRVEQEMRIELRAEHGESCFGELRLKLCCLCR